MPKIADIWKLGALNTPTDGDVPYSWAQRLERSLKWLERVQRLIHLRVEQATVAPVECRHYVDTDFVVTNDSTLAPVPNLSFDLPNTGAFVFYARLVFDCGAGFTQYTLGGTAGYSLLLWHSSNQDDATGAYSEFTRHTATGDIVLDTTTTAGIIELRGLGVVNVAGTVRIEFAQRSPDAAASTILAGSWFEVHEAANPVTT